MRSVTNAFVWLLCLITLVGAAIWRQPDNVALLDTNILNLLPENRQDPVAQRAFDNVAREMEDQVLFLVASASKQTALEAAQAFSGELATLPMFEQVDGQLSSDLQSAWVSFYAPYKQQLLTDEQRARLTQDPARQTAAVIQNVYNPFSGVTGAELAHDPFLLFRDYLQALNKQDGRFTLEDGYLVSQHDGQFYVLVRATLAGSAYSLAVQQQLPSLTALEARIRQDFRAGVYHTGVVFYAAFGTQSAKSEISTIGVGSMAGILLLVLWVYRSLLPVSLTLLSIGSGIVTAFSVCLLVFGQIHLFSLVIGASLIGVSIDYAFHYLTDRLASGNQWQSRDGLRRVFVPITFGLVSTLIAYLSMLIAPFPGLQQLALFSAAGLIGAYLSVMCWYPLLARKPATYQKLPLPTLSAGYLKKWQRPSVRKALPLLAAAVSVWGLVNADYDDNIRQLQSLPPTLQSQEAVIKTVTRLSSAQPMLLVKGDSEQAVLETAHALTPALEKLKSKSALSGYQNPADFVPPVSVQKADFQLVQSLYRQEGANLAAQIGLTDIPAEPVVFKPLLPGALQHASVGKLLSSLWLPEENGQHAAIVMLQNVADMTAVSKAIEPFPSVSLLNKAEEVSTLFGQYRSRISLLMGLACLLIAGVLAARFGLRPALRILLPPLLAAGVGLAAGALSPVPMNLFNLLALFLVLGIGIDYTLFFAEHKDSDRALVANTLAAFTTLLAFGLLSLSNTEAIHSFGITVLVGICTAWLLAPLAAPLKEKDTAP